jgi:membrane protein DedA with SNARE-associated domain
MDMTKTRMIGWSAMAVCGLGYASCAVVAVLAKTGALDTTMALLFGAIAALIGEGGLWVAAGCLGLTIFKKRQALFDRVFRRRKLIATEA